MRLNRQLTATLLLITMVSNVFIPLIDFTMEDTTETKDINSFDPFDGTIPTSIEEGDPIYPSNIDIGKILADNEHEFNEIYEPWKSKAAIHAIAYDEATGFLALGGGYLYDNEVHLYRLNTETGEFDKVWDMGGDIIQSDVLSLDIGDTDLNDFIEIVAGSADGHVYVFEQRHIFDPVTNTENMFDLVWTSPSMFRVFDVKIEDVDLDYRPDIVVGSWDGLFLYEYDTHSGYPFSDEHWIDYKKVWEATDMGDDNKIYSLEAGDTNENGLPEIVVGTREGTVYVYENDGTTIWNNGDPFPLINDNNYALNWTSEGYTDMPINSMAIGELDGTPGDEIALISQGQGVFVLDWDDSAQTYNYQKVVKDFEDWETFGYWGLDSYADSVISATNVTYHDLLNTTLIVEEPIDYIWDGSKFIPDTLVYPYNTGMAGASDGNYTIFNASAAEVDYSSAIVDFGADEEGTGSASSNYDVLIDFKQSVGSEIFTEFNFSISQDGLDFEQVDNIEINRNANTLEIDVDYALVSRNWEYFRYVKITVYNGGEYEIDSLELSQVYNLLTDALSLTIGPLKLDGTAHVNGLIEQDKIVIGTVTGKYIAAEWSNSESKYDIVWDSGNDDSYTEATGIWDIEPIHTTTDVPIWRFLPTTGSEPIGQPELDPEENTPGFEYNSWTVGKLNYNYLQTTPITSPTDTYYLTGTKNSAIQVYDSLGNFDDTSFAYLNQINSWLSSEDKPYTSVEVLDMFDPAYALLPLLVVSSYNPDQLPTGTPVGSNTATIDFWHRESFDLTSDYSGLIGIGTLDETGEITTLLSVSTTTPKIDFADYDNDGDFDMVFTNGNLYMAKNLDVENGISYGDMKFVLIRDYFEDVNKEINGNIGQTDMFDIDQDGDLDLILNYADEDGTTCFLNTGTLDNPIWEQDKNIFSNSRPETNMNNLGYTDTRILESYTGNTLDVYAEMYSYEDIEDYSMVTFDTNTYKTMWSEPVYDVMDTYLVATYPEVMRKEFCLLDASSSQFQNYGFHIRESWNTEDDLNGWTLSISSGDLDNDGKGEIIVGDYDNNVYVFENLVNNTYKRMYQTFDLSHTETSTESPYMHDDLQGISGEFSRNIWDNAKNLITDVDLDQDGLKELIVSADLQLYIFEDMNLTGGDQMQFEYIINLRDGPFVGEVGWDQVKEITAIEAGIDLDYDGNLELIIAAGPYLHVYNVPKGSFTGTENNDYFATSPELGGRYDLIGNPLSDESREYAIINALAVGDTDQDGYREIILGGINDSRAMVDSGFTFIYEVQGGTFSNVWQPTEDHTYNNPINVIMLDDQDYDGKEEIIIGHTQGVDIWEWSGSDSNYNNVEYITSSPNYPIVELNGEETITSLCTDFERPDRPTSSSMANDESGDFIMHVYTSTNSNIGSYDYLHWKTYNKITKEWSVEESVNPSVYTLSDGGNLYGETEPSVTCDQDGNFYLTWISISNLGNNEVWASKFNGVTWGSPVNIFNQVFSGSISYPDIFEFSPTHVAILFTYLGQKIAYNLRDKSDLSGVTLSTAIEFEGHDDFEIHSASIATMPNGEFTIAFSGKNEAISKPDYDIWNLYLDSSFTFSGVSPNQATTSYNDELFPDIAYMHTDGEDSIIISYDNAGLGFEEKIGIVASTDKGKNWGRQNTLNSVIPSFIKNENLEDGYVSWEYNNSGTILPMLGPMALSPCIVGLDNEGFMYSFTATSWSSPLKYSYMYQEPNGGFVEIRVWIGWNAYGINPQSDWIGNTLLDVVDLDVGDTDGDNRNEIIAGWDNQVGVYELKSSLDPDSMMVYEETWLSDQFTNSFTGVTVYDSNGNGWDEIGIATERGDVFLLEARDPSIGATTFVSSTTEWNQPLSAETDNNNFEKYDIDGDGIDEIIVGGIYNEPIFAHNNDGTILWTNNDAYKNFGMMKLLDITGDGRPEIIATTQTQNIVAFNITNGNQLWNYTVGGGQDMVEPIVGDIDNDGDIELAVSLTNGSIVLLNHDGTYLGIYDHQWESDIISLALGNFTGGDHLSIAYTCSDGGVLSVCYPLNGTLIYQSVFDVAGDMYSDTIAYDLDSDGIDEVIFGKNGISILDVVSGEIYFNSTEYSEIANEIFVKDFDGDGKLEILAQTMTEGIFLVDITTGTTQWHYNPDIGLSNEIISIDIGDFGGTGDWDICIGSDRGDVITIDGQNGIPIWWFLHHSLRADAIKSVRIPGSDVDGVVTVFETDLSLITQDLSPTYPDVPTIEYKESYMSWDLGKEIIGVWIHDIDQDGIDDILTQTSDNYLRCVNMKTETEMWNHYINGPISILKVGHLFDEDHLDIVVPNGNRRITIISGINGEYLDYINIPKGYGPKFIEVADFFGLGDNDEIAIMWAIILPNPTPYHYLTWYNEKGVEQFSAEYQQEETVNEMISGNFSGNEKMDVAIALEPGVLEVYDGRNGIRDSFYLTDDSIVALRKGDFDSAGYDDIVLELADSNITLLKCDGGSFSHRYTIHHGQGSVRSFQVVDLLDTGFDQLAIDIYGEGIKLYDGTGFTGTQYETTKYLTVGNESSIMIFGDINGDGIKEMVVTNVDYFQYINATTKKVDWSHKSNFQPKFAQIGDFTGKQHTLVYADGNKIMFVYGSNKVPNAFDPFTNTISIQQSSFILVLGIAGLMIVFSISMRNYLNKRKKIKRDIVSY